MSEYYDFYLVRKDTEGKFHMAGPYYKDKDGEMKFRSLYTRSRSFIDGDELKSLFSSMSVNDMDEEIASFASSSGLFTDKDKKYSMAYILPCSQIERYAKEQPRKGYVELENYSEDPEDLSGLPLMKCETYCALPQVERDKYAFVAYTDTWSPGYVLNVIAEAIYDAALFCARKDDYYIMMVVG